MLTDKLAYWINERDSIRREKEGGMEKPWSDDVVFQTTYFCNVHREDDRVTRWIAENWRVHYPHPNFELAMIMSRLINWPPSLEIIGFPFEWNWEEYLNKFRAIEGKKWGNAYVITTHGQKMPKDLYVFQSLDAIAPYSQEIRLKDTCERTYEFLQGFDGLGSFLSAQVVADLKNTEGHPLNTAEDRHRFAAHGPGSLRGLSWFFDEKVTPRTFHTALYEAWDAVEPYVEDSIKPIDMQDLQNCFCEFDKYMRVSEGTGRSKRRYPGK